MDNNRIKIGVVGYGYWGPNIIRNFNTVNDFCVKTVCDIQEASLKRALDNFPFLEQTKNYKEVTRSADIDAVAIVTPVRHHFEIAKDALLNGKHIFVEKPFTYTSKEAEELIEIASRKKLVIMVDHTFIFTGAVQRIKSIIDSNELGKLYYYDSTRINLGLFQNDVNVIWDLAPHDFSIMDFLLDKKIESLSAHGLGHFNRDLENVAYITLCLEDNLIAHFNFNWLSPVKIRQTLVGAESKMLIWNDLDPDEKIKIYDKGVDLDSKEKQYNLQIGYRSGDIYSPKINGGEALKKEAEYFRDCLVECKDPINNGESGLKVIRLLEATDRSIKNKGCMIEF